MKGSREQVLDRIRRALEAKPGPRLEAGLTIPRGYRQQSRRSAGEVLDLFVHRLSDYNATVHRVSELELPARIAERLAVRGARRLALPHDLPPEWLSQIPEGAVELLKDAAPSPSAPADPGRSTPLSHGQLASVHGVVTGCALAIAETGTIVLDSGAAQGRRALTLLPDYHLCVVLGHQVVELVPEGAAGLGRALAERRAPLTLVSGPSATSDIELMRVEGVHGPRTLDVILVQGEP